MASAVVDLSSNNIAADNTAVVEVFDSCGVVGDFEGPAVADCYDGKGVRMDSVHKSYKRGHEDVVVLDFDNSVRRLVYSTGHMRWLSVEGLWWS